MDEKKTEIKKLENPKKLIYYSQTISEICENFGRLKSNKEKESINSI